MKKKRWMLCAVLLAAAIGLLQAGRYRETYPLSLIPPGKGIGSTLFVASCEPYHPYLENHRPGWYYLYQADDGGEDFDANREKLIQSNPVHPARMNNIYQVETYQVNESAPGAIIWSQETLPVTVRIQKRVNALASRTSQETPLYFVWYEGNLYGVIGSDAYPLCRGKGRTWALSLPDFDRTRHTPTVISLGPISADDYYESPASPS